MNPLALIGANLRAHPGVHLLFALLIAVSVALAIGVTAQERALRDGAARAADRFDLIVGAPGGRIDLLLAMVFARPVAVGLIDGGVLAALQADPRAAFVAPVAFGDTVLPIGGGANGHGIVAGAGAGTVHRAPAGFLGGRAPVLGTTAAFASHLGPLAAGRMFATRAEAVAGATSGLDLGDQFEPGHGHGAAAEGHDGIAITVVGRMAPTGTPWDRAVIVPVEQVWDTHGLALGHDPAGPRAEALGPPFDPAFTPGLPGIIVRPASLRDAYALRQAWATPQTQAFFPAESLGELYRYLGDVTRLLQGFALATQGLVLLAILAGVAALGRAQRRQMGVLRALGAPPLYIAMASWGGVMALIGAGVVLGLALGWGAATLVAQAFAAETGMALTARLTGAEVTLAATTLGLGALLALIPAALSYTLRIPTALAGD